MNSNPNLDGTIIPQYLVWVYATDGIFLKFAQLLVNITIVNDPPVITNLPDKVAIVENTVGIATVFDVNSTDPENDVVTYTMTSLQTPSPFVIDITSK